MQMLNMTSMPKMAQPASLGAGSAPSAPAARQAGGGNPFASLAGGRGTSAPSFSVLNFTALGRGLSQFQPGQTLSGQVVSQEPNGMFNMRFGNTLLQAPPQTPLSVGQQLNVTVTDRGQGTLGLQMSTAPPPTAPSEALTQTLVKLDIPMSEGNYMLANSMAEHGAPLDKATFQSLQKALAQLPQTSNPSLFSARVGATLFLQNNQLPVTAQNITLLSNFIAQHPQLGQQIFNLQGDIKRLLNNPQGVSARALQVLDKAPGLLGEMLLGPGGEAKGMGRSNSKAKALFDLARQAGIETNLALVGGADPDWELLALMRQLRSLLNSKQLPEGALSKNLGAWEENVAAQRLINQGTPDSSLGFYFMQIPLRYHLGERAEVWLRYRIREDGARVVDSEGGVIEFYVQTEALGEICYKVEIAHGALNLEAKVENEEILGYLEAYLPALGERLQEAGWLLGNWSVDLQDSEARELVDCHELSTLEALDVQA